MALEPKAGEPGEGVGPLALQVDLRSRDIPPDFHLPHVGVITALFSTPTPPTSLSMASSLNP